MVRFGIIGMGNMGKSHARSLLEGHVPGATLTAVCDRSPETLAAYGALKTYSDSADLIRSGEADAVLIATPHFDHTGVGIDALQAGLHVLVEKPISVHKADCERLLAAHTNPEQVFGAVFNQRTDPHYRKMKALIANGELGEIHRVSWVITDWYRTERYYASGGWRATWSGDGGGVLLNQCPHNLDLYQWLFGMPVRLRAFCGFGKYHDIEVEDDVTAYVEFPNGATGTFIASTGEAPGTNRLEIAAERGRLVYEDDKLTFGRNEVEAGTFSRTSDSGYAMPERWDITFPDLVDHGPQHRGILRNFVDAVQGEAELLAPAAEGIHSVELANAMILSAIENRIVDLPIDAAHYESLLQGDRIKQLLQANG